MEEIIDEKIKEKGKYVYGNEIESIDSQKESNERDSYSFSTNKDSQMDMKKERMQRMPPDINHNNLFIFILLLFF